MFDLAIVERRLAHYLGAPVARIRILASGWETTVFEFTLAPPASNVRIPVSHSLVLRFYQGAGGEDKCEREHLVLSRLAPAGYPVPRPYLFERAPDAMGGPFLIMDRSDGGPLFQHRSFPQAFKTFALAFFAFVKSQVVLHRLDPGSLGLDKLPRALGADRATPSAVPLLDRMLETIANRIETGPLPALRPMLEWARGCAPRFQSEADSVLHLDYHPQNVVVKGIRVTGIIDWVNTDLGDRHLDAATTSAILSSSAMERPRWMRRNVAGNTLRKTFASLHFALYHAMAPLDFERFRFCQAVAALQRLSMLEMIRARGPESMGFRAEAIHEVTPAVLALLSRFASRKSGIPIRMDRAAPAAA